MPDRPDLLKNKPASGMVVMPSRVKSAAGVRLDQVKRDIETEQALLLQKDKADELFDKGEYKEAIPLYEKYNNIKQKTSCLKMYQSWIIISRSLSSFMRSRMKGTKFL